jgi:hypothetical protein
MLTSLVAVCALRVAGGDGGHTASLLFFSSSLLSSSPQSGDQPVSRQGSEYLEETVAPGTGHFSFGPSDSLQKPQDAHAQNHPRLSHP